jgi:predicted alpha/beta superfamily hydrolase
MAGRRVAVLAALACAVMGPRAGPARGDAVSQLIVVEVPATTPAAGPVWISGDLPVLGAWNGAGVRLEPTGDGRWAARIALEAGTAFEFKVTRGDWATVEKDARGGEIANRRARAAERDTLRVVVGAWRDQSERVPERRSTLTGEVRRHAAFASRFVRARDVLVWLPPGYADEPRRRYPVLYFHDGNNVLDAATSFKGIEWGADETAERLVRAGRLRPFILVAVYNTPDRMAEYTFTRDARHGGGEGAAYGRFLTEELMPFVERTYRTRRGPLHTGLVGSSLGALVSLELALARPGRFGLVGCLSPAAWWGERATLRRVEAWAGGSCVRCGGRARVWLDIGTAEGTVHAGEREWLTDARALRDALLSRGWREGADLHYEEVEGAVHDEGAWAARLDRVLLFLLGPPGH